MVFNGFPPNDSHGPCRTSLSDILPSETFKGEFRNVDRPLYGPNFRDRTWGSSPLNSSPLLDRAPLGGSHRHPAPMTSAQVRQRHAERSRGTPCRSPCIGSSGVGRLVRPTIDGMDAGLCGHALGDGIFASGFQSRILVSWQGRNQPTRLTQQEFATLMSQIAILTDTLSQTRGIAIRMIGYLTPPARLAAMPSRLGLC